MDDLVNAICGIDCKPRQGACNGYCVGKADHPPLIQRQDVMTPEGSNADEWLLFITEHSPEFVAVQIAERLDEITALRARLEAVTEERNVQNDLRQIAEDAADELRGRAERAEAALATARRDAEPYIIMIGPYRGVCVGGRWNNWLFHKHADGHWISQQKLNSEPLSSALANEAETSARGMPCPSR